VRAGDLAVEPGLQQVITLASRWMRKNDGPSGLASVSISRQAYSAGSSRRFRESRMVMALVYTPNAASRRSSFEVQRRYSGA
jgi:hypothetical protein